MFLKQRSKPLVKLCWRKAWNCGGSSLMFALQFAVEWRELVLPDCPCTVARRRQGGELSLTAGLGHVVSHSENPVRECCHLTE